MNVIFKFSEGGGGRGGQNFKQNLGMSCVDGRVGLCTCVCYGLPVDILSLKRTF